LLFWDQTRPKSGPGIIKKPKTAENAVFGGFSACWLVRLPRRPGKGVGNVIFDGNARAWAQPSARIAVFAQKPAYFQNGGWWSPGPFVGKGGCRNKKRTRQPPGDAQNMGNRTSWRPFAAFWRFLAAFGRCRELASGAPGRDGKGADPPERGNFGLYARRSRLPATLTAYFVAGDVVLAGRTRRQSYTGGFPGLQGAGLDAP